jgi:hypothetical protein
MVKPIQERNLTAKDPARHSRNQKEREVSRAKLPKIAKFRQIPLFPLCQRGMKGGFLDCFAHLACLARENLVFSTVTVAGKFARAATK